MYMIIPGKELFKHVGLISVGAAKQKNNQEFKKK